MPVKTHAMKHTLKVTWILILIFLLTQVIGLATINKYIKVGKQPSGEIKIVHEDTVLGPQPELKEEEKTYTFIHMIIIILIGTAILLLFIKLNLSRLWKFWFLLSVFITLSVSFGVYVNSYIALAFALLLALLKVYKKNIFIHNFTEIFIYTGITIIILPFFKLFSAFMMLIVISVYDMIAVWKSKHMIKLAKFQIETKLFAGLFVPYKGKNIEIPKEKGKDSSKEEVQHAILGGGDIAFPLIFSAAVMEHLILVNSLSKITAFLATLLIPLFVSIALAFLLFKSKKDTFYPAMPFLSIGAFIGYGIIFLLV